MTLSDPEQIAMRLWVGLDSVDEIDRWAETSIAQSADVDPLVYDILEADRELKRDLFTDFLWTR